ncbi:leucyl/phenylalanyl-tRNA--protein transferase [Flavobacterium caeni]|uniref:Leucyl/phenylalanyl-tRNA--protein transferase n=1 Tax=Flavobacterium caeni TaxID=490189 RepID=A0A1G5II77_9FLAO|nr:leucyl/phenylalanyl-tRNA--protein transferase [Flavobacterium caeni]SCY75687.1 leucyl/phenylalanyl-tRNA--protein transferase [Flavobacterium caeni]
MYFLSKDLFFPAVETADENGLLAIGGDLSPERLMLAYRHGIFPWFDQDDPILWWSPDPRMVLFLDEFTVSKSMRNILNRGIFEVTFNRDFRGVITHCKKSKRKGQTGTWITDEIVEAYCKLHELGKAQSVEVWQEGRLVGGLYGTDLGHVFCGESMFSVVSNASKVAFIALVEHLRANQYKLLDCQLYNDHLALLGCREIPRAAFIRTLKS